MIEIWIDAQLSPSLAAWINENYPAINARSVRSLGLRDAEDGVIFQTAREAGVTIMSKDSDFLDLLEKHGPPPKVIWVTCGNTSNQKMRSILKQALQSAIEILENGEALVEIGDIEVA